MTPRSASRSPSVRECETRQLGHAGQPCRAAKRIHSCNTSRLLHEETPSSGCIHCMALAVVKPLLDWCVRQQHGPTTTREHVTAKAELDERHECSAWLQFRRHVCAVSTTPQLQHNLRTWLLSALRAATHVAVVLPDDTVYILAVYILYVQPCVQLDFVAVRIWKRTGAATGSSCCASVTPVKPMPGP